MRKDLVRVIGAQQRGEHARRALTAFAVARFAAAAGPAVAVLLADGRTPEGSVAAWVVVSYAAVRVVFAQPNRFLLAADATVASVAIALTGLLASPMLAFGVACAVATGLQTGVGHGAIAGVLVVAASLPSLAGRAGSGIAELNHVATWVALFPLSGIAAGFAARVWRDQDEEAKAESERKRIARDLHDGVAQTLAHLRLELDMLAHPAFTKDRDPDEIAKLARVAERTLTDVRAMISNLAAPAPVDSLADSLAAYVIEMQTSHGPQLVYRTEGQVPRRHPAAGEVFRIAQEAISNAVRHARATRIDVTLSSRTDGSMRLVVEDDGIGIAGPREGGLGLTAMRERAASFGGRCDITTPPAGGTRIDVHAPTTLVRIA